jgi:tetratricopeptide (TPR) repeat protein
MINHQAFFEYLANADQTSPAWQPVVAGLAVLRFVDTKLGDGVHCDDDWAHLESIRGAVNGINEGDPVRSVLMSIIEAASEGDTQRATVGRALLAYGRALNFEGKWSLACDVYAAADSIAGAPANPDISIRANIGLGAAARQMAQWDKSEHAYSRATHIAETVGDTAGVLLVDVRRSTTLMLRGNLPEAEALAIETVNKARAGNFKEPLGLALHSRSSIAFSRGDYAAAVQIGYEALEEMPDSAERDGVLADIASAFGAMGINDAARDGYLIVSATAQSQWVRWNAMLNLMELAFMDGNEIEFEKYVHELGAASLPPKLRAVYHIFSGQGFERFGENGEASLETAVSIAEQSQLHQIAHQARVALAELKSQETIRRETVAPPSDIDPSLRWIVSELSSLREAAVGPLS